MQAVILAAGASSRFWPLNQRHKSLLKIMGRPLIFYTIESLKKAGIKEAIIVQGPKKDVEQELSNYDISGIKIGYVIQEEPKGMGNALTKAKDLITGPFFVLHAHKANAGDFVKLLMEKFKKTKAELIFLGTKTSQPWLYGMLDFEGDKAKGLIEKPEKGKEPSDIKVIGLYLLPEKFFEYYEKVSDHQYNFEDALDLYMKENDARVAIVEKELTSFKFPWHLFEMNKVLIDEFLENKIAKSAKIAKDVVVDGKVYIGENVKVFEGAVIKGPCYIGDDSIIGNNALVREYTNLENKTMIGGLSEVVRCIFQEDVHTHSGYFGDSILSKGCRVGAGTVTANVRIDRGEIDATVKGKEINTKLKKFGVVAGEDTRFGVNASLMPGVLIGSNCDIGPHSIVLKNIEDNKVFYTKAESVLKDK